MLIHYLASRERGGGRDAGGGGFAGWVREWLAGAIEADRIASELICIAVGGASIAIDFDPNAIDVVPNTIALPRIAIEINHIAIRIVRIAIEINHIAIRTVRIAIGVTSIALGIVRIALRNQFIAIRFAPRASRAVAEGGFLGPRSCGVCGLSRVAASPIPCSTAKVAATITRGALT